MRGLKTVFRLTQPIPSTNNLYINVRRGRIPSQQYETWKQEAQVDYLRQRPKPVTGPVNITMEFQEPKRRRDIDNMTKAPLDFLVKTGIIEADDQTIVRKLNLAWSDEVEGCRITIESIFGSVASVESELVASQTDAGQAIKDQAAHDIGFLTMRFSGSRIHRSADACAKEIFDFVCGGQHGANKND